MNKIVSPEVVGAIADTLRESAGQPPSASQASASSPADSPSANAPASGVLLFIANLLFEHRFGTILWGWTPVGRAAARLFGWPGLRRRSGYQCRVGRCEDEVARPDRDPDGLGVHCGRRRRGSTSAGNARLRASRNPFCTRDFLGILA